jgi:hypothetical protein
MSEGLILHQSFKEENLSEIIRTESEFLEQGNCILFPQAQP